MLRRRFLSNTGVAATATAATLGFGQETKVSESEVRVELPRMRVPLSFIIDDSTCLVNMGKFCMPQFAATYPERKDYQKPWQDWPDEIPDSFVRTFGEWCAENGVKGKYSIVPYPACVGWLDRTLPGWSQKQLKDSLKLVRDLMLPNWDIHPEMITHTRVIDLKTGRPFADYSPARMENSYPQEDVSVDYLASYLAYALRILKNCDLPCEGVTTPGGFGNRVKQKLSQAVFESVRDVYGTDLPHYFKYVKSGDESTEPVSEAHRPSQQGTDRVMNVPAGTGDWYGGWDGAEPSQGFKYCDASASKGRMVELIEKQQPAVMLCHWPGMYCGGTMEGFHDFQKVVTSLNAKYSNQTLWMKVSEIGRYWAAKESTKFELKRSELKINASYSCQGFTVRIPGRYSKVVLEGEAATRLKPVTTAPSLASGCSYQENEDTLVCFDLPKGATKIRLET